MRAHDVLQHGASILADRAETYGDARANMADIAARMSRTLGMNVTPQQVCLLMIDVKLARLKQSPLHQDSMIDIMNYAAICVELSSN